jgi:broad specificity phosphatase PhoE
MRLLLVRHGQSEGNATGVVQGHVDFGLSALGWRQAEATAATLAALKVDRVVSSPLRRAFDTATVIGAAVGVEIEAFPGLMEYNIGEASGLTGPQIRERFPDIMSAYRRGERPQFPGEEGREIFLQRVSGVLEELRDTDLSVVAVAHGGVVGALCYAALGLDYGRPGLFRVANCSITEFGRDRAGRVVVHRINDICHLGEHVTANDLG